MIALGISLWTTGTGLAPEPSAPSLSTASISPSPAFVGATLTAGYTGDRGYPAGALTYVWLLDGYPINGATAATYEPVDAGTGRLSVTVTATNDTGSDSATSAAVDVIDAPVAGSLGPFTLAVGVAIDPIDVSEAFTADGDPTLATVSYAVIGSLPAGLSMAAGVITGTPSVAFDDDVTVRATNGAGADDLVFAVEVLAVPVITNAGTISGSGKIGAEHTVTGFTYTGTGTVTYQWNRDGSPISGATSAAYTPDAADDETDLTRTTTVTNDAGSDSDTTAAVAITFNAPTWGTIPAQEWTLDSGVQTLDLTPYLTVAGASISDVSVTVQLLDAADAVFAEGVFEDGVFEGGAGSPSHISVAYTGGAWLLSIDTDETGELDGATVELRASNSGGSADTSFAATVAEGAPAENFSLTLNGSDELVFEGVASSLVLNENDELEIDYA